MFKYIFYLKFFFKNYFFFAEEQERVQKKTFTNWINSYLSKVSFFLFLNTKLDILAGLRSLYLAKSQQLLNKKL